MITQAARETALRGSLLPLPAALPPVLAAPGACPALPRHAPPAAFPLIPIARPHGRAQTILNRAAPDQKPEDCEFEPNEVYAIDIVVSTGEPGAGSGGGG